MTENIADIRREYALRALAEDEVAADPIEQFGRWFAEARAADVSEPTAFTLATSSPDGRPSARVMLLKGVDARGFVFFTNYEGRKGRELHANPNAAMAFFWDELERQVRVEGAVGRIPAAESDAYFASRPRGSQLGAWASAQSETLASKQVLHDKLAELERRYDGAEVPRPPHWGGFVLAPSAVEFWQGRPSRLHDRLVYTRTETGWGLRRLSP